MTERMMQGLSFAASIYFPLFQMKRKIQSLYYDRRQARQNISGHLTYCKRKRGDIKHNLTETTNKYKVQNSVSKIKNVLIQKQLEEAFKPVVMQSLPTSLASKCSKLKTHIQPLNCKILNKINKINQII